MTLNNKIDIDDIEAVKAAIASSKLITSNLGSVYFSNLTDYNYLSFLITFAPNAECRDYSVFEKEFVRLGLYGDTVDDVDTYPYYPQEGGDYGILLWENKES